MLKRVDASKYDQKYFQDRNEYADYENLADFREFNHIHQKAGSMMVLKKDDKAVDLGCGSGQLAFYLYLKYGCGVTGLDYSRDAIDLGNNNLNKLSVRDEYSNIKEKVKFIQADSEHLPDFSNIRAVFLVDVVEHLYDSELDVVLRKIKQWNREGGLKLVVHTDNNDYLRFICPMTDCLAVLLKKTSFQKIKENKFHNSERHINLTTARKLKKKLLSYGFRVLKVNYPPMDMAVIRAHLGEIAEIKPILRLAYYFGKIFRFLRPSFYLLAEYRKGDM